MANDDEMEVQSSRRGRPKKTGSEDTYFEPDMDLPAIASLPASSRFSTSHPYRLHAAHPLPLVHLHDEDEDMSERQEVQDSLDGPSAMTSDDAFESDEEVSGERGGWTSGIDLPTFPPSPPRSLTESNARPRTNASNRDDASVEHLREEVKELRKRVKLSSAMTARMAHELTEAHAEIARLRMKNELLERGIGRY